MYVVFLFHTIQEKNPKFTAIAFHDMRRYAPFNLTGLVNNHKPASWGHLFWSLFYKLQIHSRLFQWTTCLPLYTLPPRSSAKISIHLWYHEKFSSWKSPLSRAVSVSHRPERVRSFSLIWGTIVERRLQTVLLCATVTVVYKSTDIYMYQEDDQVCLFDASVTNACVGENLWRRRSWKKSSQNGNFYKCRRPKGFCMRSSVLHIE